MHLLILDWSTIPDMQTETISKLHQLTTAFYTVLADEFSKTRQAPWSGWEQVADIVNKHFSKTEREISALDLGCGNGRLLTFLKESSNFPFAFTGIDSNPAMLQKAKELLSTTKVTGKIKQIDILENLQEATLAQSLNDQKADLITSFGVFHHIPSEELRARLILNLAELLQLNGLLIISFWQFAQFERFKPKQLDPSSFGISANELEEGDYLLGWGSSSNQARYCHSFSSAEIQKLAVTSKLEPIAQFTADGKEGNVNTYLVLHKKQQ